MEIEDLKNKIVQRIPVFLRNLTQKVGRKVYRNAENE
jgi:hypothetical protein